MSFFTGNFLCVVLHEFNFREKWDHCLPEFSLLPILARVTPLANLVPDSAWSSSAKISPSDVSFRSFFHWRAQTGWGRLLGVPLLVTRIQLAPRIAESGINCSPPVHTQCNHIWFVPCVQNLRTFGRVSALRLLVLTP